LEASTLTYAQRRGLFARRSPLLRFQSDENLVALTRKGHQHAFDSLVERYQARLLGFCRQMLGCTEDAEDVLQEVFVAAYNAMVADERPIAVRPWLYRIARNRCLNHLRRPSADGQDTMDTHPHMNGVTTHERVQNREEFRNLLSDVGRLPETQRSALLLREIDAMSYEEIAQAMDTTVPGVKSLLVRARIALAESSQARQLTCDEVRLELAEAAEGLAKLGGPARRHIKACDACREFRVQLRCDTKALAAIFPAGPLLFLKGALIAKLSGLFGGGGSGAAAGGSAAGGSAAGAGAGAGAAGAGAAGAGAAGAGAAGAGAAGAGAAAASGTAAVGGAAAAGGAAAGGGAVAAASGAAAAIGTKAAAGLATAAIIAGGAAEIKHVTDQHPSQKPEANTSAIHRAVPAVVEPQTPAPAIPPADAAHPAQPATVAPPPSDTVTVPPQPADQATATEATVPLHATKHKRHKTPVTANTDQGTSTSQSGPITTAVEPSTSTSTSSCDANGDGVTDVGAPTTCTTDSTVTTGVEQPAAIAPATTTYVAPKKHKAAPKKQVTRRAQAR
jgi:RNA polymerase sigma factor (sigma-70 family)